MSARQLSKIIIACFAIISACFITFYLIILWQLWGPGLSGQTKLVYGDNIPVGGDFAYFYAASLIGVSQNPSDVYDLSSLRDVEEKVLGYKVSAPWFYPPTFLLMLLPLSLFSYIISLAIWLFLTLFCYLFVLNRIATHPVTILMALAFPGTFLNFLYGHNGFLSTALMGGGLLLLDRSPITGGALLGAMSYKPQFALLIPLVLGASRRWKALGGALASASALTVASILILGGEVWQAFLHNISAPIELINRNPSYWHRMPTIFAAVLESGGNMATAWIIHGVTMVFIAGLVIWVWRDNSSPSVRNSIFVLGSLLFSHHAFFYDLAILSIPLLYLGCDGLKKGWLPGEKILLVVGWLLPFFIYPFNRDIRNLPLGPLIIGALLWMALRRERHERHTPV